MQRHTSQINDDEDTCWNKESRTNEQLEPWANKWSNTFNVLRW